MDITTQSFVCFVLFLLFLGFNIAAVNSKDVTNGTILALIGAFFGFSLTFVC